ncbi:MAG TPA: AAA domain-containing protein [Firmicutes bacterium]|nr:AAA domain-containing protein [Bacillota bacterium]
MADYSKNVEESVKKLKKLREEMHRVIVGQDEVLDLIQLALLCEGHVLLEGVPGLGKTLMVRTLAHALSLGFSRIQFTPDLMPADVLGNSIVMQEKAGDFTLRFEKGPIFANLVLADEINRASPKTQSALLEAMQEQAVTVRGERYELPRPFQVLATQNPLEMEGTYPLPEAQVDRFLFKIIVRYPSERELITIMERTLGAETPTCQTALNVDDLRILQKAVREVVVPPQVSAFAVRLILATQPGQESAPAKVREFVRYGAGPRGAQALILGGKARALSHGRFNVSLEDIKELAVPALRHRVALNFDGLSEGIQVGALIKDLCELIPVDYEQPAAIRS